MAFQATDCATRMQRPGMDLGGDLPVLSWLYVDPAFRGNKLGHSILKAILGAAGGAVSLVVPQTPRSSAMKHQWKAARGTPRRRRRCAATGLTWLPGRGRGLTVALGEVADAFDV